MALHWDLSDDEQPVKVAPKSEVKEAPRPVEQAPVIKDKPKKHPTKPSLPHEKKDQSKVQKRSAKKPVGKRKPEDSETPTSKSLVHKATVAKKKPLKTTHTIPPAATPTTEVSTEGTEEPPKKKKRSQLTENKRKSLKYKERKRKAKLNKLKSLMPKEELEKRLNPQTPLEAPDQAALSYLRLWHKARSAWKFNKLRQTWLLQNMYTPEALNESDFTILLEYITPLKGQSRSATLQRAQDLLDKHQDDPPGRGSVVLTRATRVLQMLD